MHPELCTSKSCLMKFVYRDISCQQVKCIMYLCYGLYYRHFHFFVLANVYNSASLIHYLVSILMDKVRSHCEAHVYLIKCTGTVTAHLIWMITYISYMHCHILLPASLLLVNALKQRYFCPFFTLDLRHSWTCTLFECILSPQVNQTPSHLCVSSWSCSLLLHSSFSVSVESTVETSFKI